MHVTKETTGFVLIYIIVCNNESTELTADGSSSRQVSTSRWFHEEICFPEICLQVMKKIMSEGNNNNNKKNILKNKN